MQVSVVQCWCMFVRKAAHRDALCDSSATVKLLSVLVTSHAERVCGEYRRALCVLHTLHV